jgi:ABC-type multidrug transport system fused ATPase/permease subunit
MSEVATININSDLHEIHETPPNELLHINHHNDVDVKIFFKKLNEDIGYHWWKLYTYSAFWNNISTPINLVITILTAITAGHSATAAIVSAETNTTIGIVVLFISLFNTFFRPAQQLNESMELMKEWYLYGSTFETKFYIYRTSGCNNEMMQDVRKLFKEVNEKKRNIPTNFFIDLLFLISKKYFIKDDILWNPTIQF